jgi:hypothetical protein
MTNTTESIGISIRLTVTAIGTASCLLLSSCSATTDENGAANLNCSGKVIPGVEYKIERLHEVEDFTLTCGEFRGDLPGPVRVQFRIYEVFKSGLPAGSGGGEAGGGGGGSASGLQSDDADEVKIPRAGIAFAPFLGSNLNMSAFRTNPEFQLDSAKCAAAQQTATTDDDDDCVVSPYVYMGIVTPAAEWCSDATGVMTYEFWMTCNGSTSTFSASVVAGAIKADSVYNYRVSN